jgi:hypothetical protein
MNKKYFNLELKSFKKETAWVLLGLFLIMSVAFAVRAYNFEDWLYFKMDQSRDALLIANALENGPAYLPLLGPRAGATELDSGYLRLGPAYYYMEYVAGILSGGNLPMSNAYPDFIFSILVIPLLYVFLRLYFSRFNSLLITAMYSFSFLIIQYSRFSWNPNALPFFFILAFYGLLKFFREKSFKKSLWWIALWSFGMAIGMQLHFFGFFSLLGTSGLMILWHWEIWKKESWKTYFSKTKLKAFAIFGGVALGMFLFISSPIIISDFFRGGENSKNFIQALSSKPEKKPLLNKINKNIGETFKYYCLLSTSECTTGEGLDKKNILPSTLVIVLMLIGLGYATFKLVKMKEQEKGRRDFLFLMVAWVTVFFILSIPVSFQIRPRFFIVVFAVPFILFGFLFKLLQEKFGKMGILLSFIFALGVIVWNTNGTLAWFEEQKLSQLGNADVKRTLILKTKDGVTLGQLQGVTDFMYSRHKQGAKLYYYVKPEHVAPIKFLLYQKKDKELQFGTIGKEAEAGAQFFAVIATGGESPESAYNDFARKFGVNYKVLGTAVFGQLTVFEVEMLDMKIEKPNMFFNRDKGSTDRVFWKDVFGLKEKAGIIELDGAE